jgi:hypothetical protein
MFFLGQQLKPTEIDRSVKAGFRVSSFHVISDNPVVHKSFLDEIPDFDTERKGRIYQKLPLLVKGVASAVSEREI